MTNPYTSVQRLDERKEAIVNFILKLSTKERFAEIKRQILCNKPDFEPYAVFKRLSRKNKGGISAFNIANFQSENLFKISNSNAHSILEFYKGGFKIDENNRMKEISNSLGYREFLNMILPKENNDLRVFITQRECFDIEETEYLSYETELALANFMNSEVDFFEELTEDKQKFENLGLTTDQFFGYFDLKNEGILNKNNLSHFFTENGINVYKHELNSFIYRLDFDKDGVISKEDFNTFISIFKSKRSQKRQQEENEKRKLSRRKSNMISTDILKSMSPARKIVRQRISMIRNQSSAVEDMRKSQNLKQSSTNFDDKENISIDVNLNNNNIANSFGAPNIPKPSKTRNRSKVRIMEDCNMVILDTGVRRKKQILLDLSKSLTKKKLKDSEKYILKEKNPKMNFGYIEERSRRFTPMKPLSEMTFTGRTSVSRRTEMTGLNETLHQEWRPDFKMVKAPELDKRHNSIVTEIKCKVKSIQMEGGDYNSNDDLEEELKKESLQKQSYYNKLFSQLSTNDASNQDSNSSIPKVPKDYHYSNISSMMMQALKEVKFAEILKRRLFYGQEFSYEAFCDLFSFDRMRGKDLTYEIFYDFLKNLGVSENYIEDSFLIFEKIKKIDSPVTTPSKIFELILPVKENINNFMMKESSREYNKQTLYLILKEIFEQCIKIEEEFIGIRDFISLHNVDIMEFFEIIDKEKLGEITSNSLKKFFSEYDSGIYEPKGEEVTLFIDYLDSDRDGRISYKDLYLKLLKN